MSDTLEYKHPLAGKPIPRWAGKFPASNRWKERIRGRDVCRDSWSRLEEFPMSFFVGGREGVGGEEMLTCREVPFQNEMTC